LVVGEHPKQARELLVLSPRDEDPVPAT